MEIEKPHWVGEAVHCEKCDTRFRLETTDEDKVQYVGKTSPQPLFREGERWVRAIFSMRYQVNCPKCDEEIIFTITFPG